MLIMHLLALTPAVQLMQRSGSCKALYHCALFVSSHMLMDCGNQRCRSMHCMPCPPRAVALQSLQGLAPCRYGLLPGDRDTTEVRSLVDAVDPDADLSALRATAAAAVRHQLWQHSKDQPLSHQCHIPSPSPGTSPCPGPKLSSGQEWSRHSVLAVSLDPVTARTCHKSEAAAAKHRVLRKTLRCAVPGADERGAGGAAGRGF